MTVAPSVVAGTSASEPPKAPIAVRTPPAKTTSIDIKCPLVQTLSSKLVGGDMSGLGIIITGAGSGVGRGLAQELCKQGHQVIATDLNLDAAKATISDGGS